MSWNGTVSNNGSSIDKSIKQVRKDTKASPVVDSVRKTRDAVIDAQLDLVAAIAKAVGEENRPISITIHGHLNGDGSGSVGMNSTIGTTQETAAEATS